MKLSIIIPSYLEEENLRILLPRINSVLKTIAVPSEVLIIDTETPLDSTAEACALYGARYIPRVGGNRYGDAVRTGIHAAQGEYCIFMDADGSHTPEFIEKLFAERERADVIIASRYIDGGDTDNGKVLVLMSWIVNAVYALVLGLNCKDVSNSFKLYHREELQALDLRCHNFDIVEEMLFKLKKRNKKLHILELPYTFKKRMFGSTKRNLVAFMVSYGWTLIRLRFGK
ncbi:hypothetical protein A3C89_01695 [Candidatus Kaiserbacteria bacterium RIFCSPHIGHO2_02_FULL_50_50]|uniref:Glycosyltransferase 2-like domain-containing protein n=1 Tax=Candidatus Kaiserbacteria bacterium RIFCSPHIGHO2_02_FULL_50_50 TaxID=1798492 RepID=A0A1F6DCD4_9BACT|nr:MAG: hypothetical protein A3C89_01695 [Candidatus Kaiserbacteria bacterium RIFCSPHIGHO2_02_FULL_50_50]OGG88297.1 MAG: hypothetical protein A3G62_03305 [Candidatus Kaiserbacteria bacterium RIFCSPLOWO2_12_FULL_50_10]